MEPETNKVRLFLEDGASLDRATAWVRENKATSIEEHLERECAHPYCAGLLDDAEDATRAEEEAAAAARGQKLLSSRVATHGVSPSAMAATVAKAMGGAPPSYGGVRDNINVLEAGREAERWAGAGRPCAGVQANPSCAESCEFARSHRSR